MNLDNLLMIPHLSRELNLIGHSPLPYTLEKQSKKNKSGTKRDDQAVEIVFESKNMLETLISVCFELVKENKKQGLNEDRAMDKVNFENAKLEKQLKSCKSEIQKQLTELAVEKEEKRQLQEKLEKLEKRLKEYEGNHKKLQKKCQNNEDLLKHALKKKELHLSELQDYVWKEFNMVDTKSIPKNFEIIHSNQPDFSKLWSEVKYSDIRTKEEALKKAVCIFQNNNKMLMEDNIMLKNLLLTTLQEVHDTTELLCNKIHLPKGIIPANTFSDVVENLDKLNVPLYKNILSEHFKVLKRISELFQEASFTVSDDLFVCWSDIVKKL